MYIISFDLGSSNFKAIIMKVVENVKEGNIELIGKVREKTTDFALFISLVKEKYSIKDSEIEAIIVTGTGASYLNDSYNEIKIIKINEFDAIGYGGLILSNHEKGIIVSIGTGTSIVYSDMINSKRIGGSGLGGGTLVGLGRAITKNNIPFLELIEIAKKGDRKNVDITIGDISSTDISNLTKDVTAANFARVHKNASNEDYVAATINLILENICLITNAYKMPYKNLDVIFIGTMVNDSYINNRLKEIGKFTKDNYVFVDNADYAIAIGAYEYYLLRLREVR